MHFGVCLSVKGNQLYYQLATISFAVSGHISIFIFVLFPYIYVSRSMFSQHIRTKGSYFI